MKSWHTQINRLFSVGFLGVTLAAALALSGCYIEVDDQGLAGETEYWADLQVDWSIHGSSAAAHCVDFGIDTWRLEVRGPENRTVVLDCQMDYWSSENDLLDLAEGNYLVRVRAFDAQGYQLATASTSLQLYDQGYVKTLAFNFVSSDFSY